MKSLKERIEKLETIVHMKNGSIIKWLPNRTLKELDKTIAEIKLLIRASTYRDMNENTFIKGNAVLKALEGGKYGRASCKGNTPR